MTQIVSKPDHRDSIGFLMTRGTEADKSVKVSLKYQTFIDDLIEKLNSKVFGEALILDSYTVATVPDATAYESGMIFVSDETGGSIPAFSDGTDWRRVTDRAVIS